MGAFMDDSLFHKESANISKVNRETDKKIIIGLVLSGGGAMGAYQVGVLQAMNQLGIKVDKVAGTSLGALNGAVVSSMRDVGEAAKILEEFWLAFGRESPLHPNIPAWIKLLLGAGLVPSFLSMLPTASSLLGITKQFFNDQIALYSDHAIKKMLDSVITDDAIANGLPFYIAAFRSRGALLNILASINCVTGFNTPDSEFFHIQSLPVNEQQQAILASAALPLIFSAQKIMGENYIDGGIGGAYASRGNTPAAPLVSADCTHLIVVHLSESTLWDRASFPNIPIIEIAIQENIRKNGLNDLLNFDYAKAQRLIQRGYEDALVSLGKVQAILAVNHASQTTERIRDQRVSMAQRAVAILDDDEFDCH